MFKKPLMQPISITIIFFFISINLFSLSAALNDEEFSSSVGPVVKKDQRKSLVVTEYGEISVIEIVDGIREPYHIQFITLEPSSLFLPVLLHADMVFYVHTGSGRLSWVDNEDLKTVDLKRGDIFRLQPGSIFYIESDLETEREKLRIYAIFANTDDEDFHLEPSIGVYSSINDLVRGFGKRTLQAAFKVPEEVIQSITNATERRVIVHAGTKKEENLWELEARYLKAFVGSIENKKKKKKDKAYNIRHAKPDFKNCNGWSTTVTKKDTHLLKGSNIGIFMVNLTKGSMMGPHWNPKASEISIVLHGQGMVRVACPSSSTNSTKCKNMRFKVKEGDVFSVTRFHPMAQISFNNDSFVFMGFSTTGRNHPQFLAGKSSVLRTLDRDVLAVSFNVTNTTIDRLLAPQGDSIILDCTSCAEEEERLMEEEIEKEKEEEEAREREEEEKKREEEEAREREEEEKKREEEKAREREEEKKRSEEEKARKRAEEEARKRAEEEARKRAEEEARKRAEEEARKRGEKEKRRREEEAEREQEEARKQQEERREKKRREEEGGGEEPGKQEAEAEREQEEARKQEQGKEKKRREEEGGGEPRKQDTEAEREQEEARRQQEERKKKREEPGGGEPWKEDAEARSEEQEKEWVKMYLKMWKG